MTVKELIEALAKYPPDALMMLEDDEGNINPVDDLELEELVQVPSTLNPKITWWYHKGALGLKGRTKHDITMVQAVMVNP